MSRELSGRIVAAFDLSSGDNRALDCPKSKANLKFGSHKAGGRRLWGQSIDPGYIVEVRVAGSYPWPVGMPSCWSHFADRPTP